MNWKPICLCLIRTLFVPIIWVAITPIGWSQPVNVLRSQLRYKFALDALVQRQLELRLYGERVAKDEAIDPGNFRDLDPPYDSRALEEFMYYGQIFDLRRMPSMDGRKEYYALIWNNLGPQEITLLVDDTTRPVVLDTFEINATGKNTLVLQRLNNVNILKVSREVLGVGAYRVEEALVGIQEDKFKLLFATMILDAYDKGMDENNVTNEFVRTMSTYKLIDLNGDGFLDIQEEVVEDLIGEPIGDDFRRARVISHISTHENRLIWNPATHAFHRED